MSIDLGIALQSVRALGVALVAWLPRMVAALVVIGLAFLIASTLRWGARRALHRHGLQSRLAHQNLQVALGRLAYVAAVAVGILIAATVAFPSFTIGSLIQLLGVSGVVIGFAFKDIFQNFLAGILLLLTNPFQVGDQIIVDSFEGTIEEIQTRATMITTYDRRRVVVPNSDLFTKAVTVNTAFERRRMRYDLTVKGGDDARRVQKLLEHTVRGGIEGVEADPVATALLISLAQGGGLTFRLLWWSGSERGEYLIVQDRVLLAVQDALKEHGLAVA
jgi:small conductance mechanosensitive channel